MRWTVVRWTRGVAWSQMDPVLVAFIVTLAVCLVLTVWAVLTRRREPPPVQREAPGGVDVSLLAKLPPDLREPLERMLTAHADGATPAEAPGEDTLLAQITEVVSAAIPLAVEAARLNDYLARFDLNQLRLQAVQDPSRRAVQTDLEHMIERRELLTTALESASRTVVSSSDPTVVAAEAHRLRLL